MPLDTELAEMCKRSGDLKLEVFAIYTRQQHVACFRWRCAMDKAFSEGFAGHRDFHLNCVRLFVRKGLGFCDGDFLALAIVGSWICRKLIVHKLLAISK